VSVPATVSPGSSRAVFAIRRRLLVRPWRNPDRRDNLRGLYAPVSLVSLPLVWMLTVTVGFMFIFWGINAGTIERSFEVSALLADHLGIRRPTTAAARSG